MLGGALSGAILWTWLDPVAALHRGLVFGMGAGWVLIALVFVLDLLLVEHGWCGHLCPLGATYGVIGRKACCALPLFAARIARNAWIAFTFAQNQKYFGSL